MPKHVTHSNHREKDPRGGLTDTSLSPPVIIVIIIIIIILFCI
jgi:hypothetical protein